MVDYVDRWKRWRNAVASEMANFPRDDRDALKRALFEFTLDELEQEYAAGDISAVLKAVNICILANSPPQQWPAWARSHLIKSIADANEGKLGPGDRPTWDTAFGKPPTPDQAGKRARDEFYPMEVYWRVKAAQAAGTPINDELFEQVGRELAIGSKTLVKELYKKARDAGSALEAEMTRAGMGPTEMMCLAPTPRKTSK